MERRFDSLYKPLTKLLAGDLWRASCGRTGSGVWYYRLAVAFFKFPEHFSTKGPKSMKSMNKFHWTLVTAVAVSVVFATTVFAQSIGTDDVKKSLRKAVEFYCNHVSTEGGYLWKYSADLAHREGENPADDQTVWVQPPGTPTIGLAFLRAYRVTGDRYYLEAASAAGHCLVLGQLESGGWTYLISFDEANRKRYNYRVDRNTQTARLRNTSTLDDDTTQAALIFLMELDAALEFKDRVIHESVQYGLEKLLDAQFPNGAFAQGFTGEQRDPTKHPILKASFPSEGTEPTRERDYWKFYTFNDNLALDVNRVFFAAAEVYGTEKDGNLVRNEKYVNAAKKMGDFIIDAQMPQPQPIWAQQYDFNMRPCWARRFEPASVTGGESQGVITAMIELYRFTGEKKYLAPIPAAIEYFERSRLPSGKVARFYEMRTNRPLYMTKEYELTYSDADVPTHYAFSVNLGSWPIDELLNMDEPTRLRQLSDFQTRYRNRSLPRPNDRVVAEVLRSLDERGAWVTNGTLRSAPDKGRTLVIDNYVFVRNVNVLLAFLSKQ